MGADAPHRLDSKIADDRTPVVNFHGETNNIRSAQLPTVIGSATRDDSAAHGIDFDQHPLPGIDAGASARVADSGTRSNGADVADDKNSKDATKLVNGLSDDFFRGQGKVSPTDKMLINEAMREHPFDLQGWANKVNEKLKATGISINVSDGVRQPGLSGDSINYTGDIVKNGKVVDSTSIGVPADAVAKNAKDNKEVSDLVKGLSADFKNNGKLSIEDKIQVSEAMRAHLSDLPGWADKVNEALKGTGTSISISGGIPESNLGGKSIRHTADIVRDNKVTDSTEIHTSIGR